MPIEFRDWITAQMLMGEPETIFVFGDNLARWGKGGQAKVMRGYPNSVGLPTKASPRDFLVDGDLATVKEANAEAVQHLTNHLAKGGLVVWPKSGIGTGLAELEARAPKIALYYRGLLAGLQSIRPTAARTLPQG
jgi:hypothetical protein